MPIDIFISHPTPYNSHQEKFLHLLEAYLQSYDLNPINLGKENWSHKSPLLPIKELINKCQAAVIVGMERYHSYIGYEYEFSKRKTEFVHRYTSTAWIQIEAGMAYQKGLPLLILKERELVKEGILDPLNSEFFVFDFNINEVQKQLPENMQKVIDNWMRSFNSCSHGSPK
ncbi:hypothetical protein [Mucilaginibacter sp. OK283]|jgi:hypothetical protein|uniref:hypothetical protein n=1 Tax=Mucilaginibacter sp. OK283 TaxID=1881049 RepID=UPI0008C91677|nr:hypothetical protein [Mucilaginibacter sp. OK283]SEO20303.1 hypothetical protein SAMN05428947_101692 [Mucilaginibacter sp. OK283]